MFSNPNPKIGDSTSRLFLHLILSSVTFPATKKIRTSPLTPHTLSHFMKNTEYNTGKKVPTPHVRRIPRFFFRCLPCQCSRHPA